MAVEKLLMMNIVGKNEYVDQVAKDILFMENIQILDAFNEIHSCRFTINVTEKNMDEILGFFELETGAKSTKGDTFINQINTLEEIYGNEFIIDKKLMNEEINLNQINNTINEIYNDLHHKHNEIKNLKSEIEKLDTSINAYEYLNDFDMEMKQLNNLEYFNYTVGTLSRDSVKRLKRNYANITAIVIHVGSHGDNEVYIVISPDDLELETERILQSLNFHRLKGIDTKYNDKPSEIIESLIKTKYELSKRLELLEKDISEVKDKYKERSILAYNIFHLYKKINEIKKQMAFSNDKFYFSGWIPERLKLSIKEKLSKYHDILIIFKDSEDEIKPPTKLRNNWFFKPFENFIKMYGVPSYDEIDPTPFLSITYMFLFGFMFGDVGQGLILFLLGLIIQKKGLEIGAIINRLGISSMFFGFIYGSIFGFENVMNALWIKPFHNINTMLSSAVIIGIFLLFIAYFYSIINKFISKDYFEGVLGKNGIVGFILYLSLLLIALPILTDYEIIPRAFLIIMILLSSIIIFLKEPIEHKIQKHDNKSITSEYYIESGFEILEIFLSMLSNTISFIRIGAFALTHVGLFLAFETMAHLISNSFGSVAVLIFGNLLIIVLEGLIVGIQSLRLQYYELFSKYFKGGGIEFNPATI